MSNETWFDRICRIIRFRQSARRRFSLHRMELGFLDSLEPRIVLSAMNGFALHAGDGSGSSIQTLETDEEDRIVSAKPSANVAGAYLTGSGTTDDRSMSFDDIKQGASDTCTFSSVLSAAALTNFSLASGLTIQSVSGSTTVYGVRMYSKTTSGSYVATVQSVTFDGTVTAEDLRPADDDEFWTTIYLRGYLDFAASKGADYRSQIFAMQSLFGAATNDLRFALSKAQEIKAALAAGKATIAGTFNRPARYPEPTFGLVSNHAYTVMGIELPASNNLAETYVTVRNPWAVDTGWEFFDTDKNGSMSLTEYLDYSRGIDGSNDGLIRLPWNVFDTQFEYITTTTRTGPSINQPLGPPVTFSPATVGPFTIGEGEHLVVPVKATGPSGKYVLYEVLDDRGNIHVQNGTYDWYPPIGSVGKHVITVRASTGRFNVADLTFVVNVTSGAPAVGSLRASPSTIKDDGSDKLTLTAKNVAVGVGTVSRVEFWHDKNFNGRIDVNSDVMVGIGTKQGVDSVWSGYVGLAVGFHRFLTRAIRYSQIADHYSNTKFVSVTVTKAVRPPSAAIPRADQTRLTPLSVGSNVNEYPIRSLQDASGHYRVLVSQETWTGSSSSTSYFVRHLDANGNLLDTDSVAEANVYEIDMYVKADGTLAVVWQTSEGHFRLQWYGASGEASSSVFALTTSSFWPDPFGYLRPEELQVAGDSQGNLTIACHVGDYFAEDIWALSVGSNGTVTRAPWLVNSVTNSMQVAPTISMNSRGEGLIAWSDADQQRIMARRFSQSGVLATEVFEVGVFGESDILIDSAIRESGEFCVTWQNQWDNSDKIFVQKFSSQGVKDGEVITANQFAGGGLARAKVALNSSGWMVVAWFSDNQSSNCYAQVFAPDGQRQGPEFSVPTSSGKRGRIDDLNLDDHGNLFFVFAEFGEFNGGGTVQTRMFDINLAPVIALNQVLTVAEKLPANTAVGIVQAEDPNGTAALTYELVGSTEFAIHPQSGMLSTKVVLDRETRSSYPLTVRVTDGTLSTLGTVTVNVSNVNDAPTVSSSNIVLAYTEQSIAARFADDYVISDLDTSIFAGGYLQVETASTGIRRDTDRISLSPARGVTVSAANKVLLNGKEIGLLVSSGIGLTPLRINLNANAALNATIALLQSLQFDCIGDNPIAGRRDVILKLNDGKGGTSLPGRATVNVAAVNDAPIIQSFDSTVKFVENALPLLLDLDAIVSDPDSADFGNGVLNVNSSNGVTTDRLGIRPVGNAAGQIGVADSSIKFSGIEIGTFTQGTSFSVKLNSKATPAAVQQLLRSITFSNPSENPLALNRTVKVTLTDGDGGTSSSVQKTIQVVPVNDAPVIGAFDTTIKYVENASPLLVDPDATVADPDSADFNGGTLTIGVSWNATSEDIIGIRHVGNGSGQIAVTGSIVKFSGVEIGTFTGITSKIIKLNGKATPAAVQQLLRSITFSTNSNKPSTLKRIVTVNLTDGDGAVNSFAEKSVEVLALNDAPVISGFSGTTNYAIGGPVTVLDSDVTVSDVDSVDFGGGKLIVSLAAATRQSTDILGLRSQGTAAGRIGVSGTSVKYGGVVIGTFTGGSQLKPLIVSLNSKATVAAVHALLRNLTFRNSHSAPSKKTRNIEVVLSDGDGATSLKVQKQIRILGR